MRSEKCAIYPLLYIIGTVRSLWTCYGADATFHRTYFWFNMNLSIFKLKISFSFQADPSTRRLLVRVLKSTDNSGCSEVVKLKMSWRGD